MLWLEVSDDHDICRYKLILKFFVHDNYQRLLLPDFPQIIFLVGGGFGPLYVQVLSWIYAKYDCSVNHFLSHGSPIRLQIQYISNSYAGSFRSMEYRLKPRICQFPWT